jgi:hypothetical protein
MRQMYIILGWMGWITLIAALGFVAGYLKAERDAKRRTAGDAAVPPAAPPPPHHEVTARDEK